MNSIHIIEYDSSHQRSVINLILGIQNDEFAINLCLNDQPDLLDIPSFYQKNKGNFWLAVYDNQVVGTIAVLDIKNNNGALRKMFVAEKFRGKTFGIGQQLLNTLLLHCQMHEIYNVFLGTTHFFEAAHKFYAKNAFFKKDVTLFPKEFPIMKCDTIFYQKTVR